MKALDLHFVRSQFPAFAEPSLEGWAFFENAGGSYACRQVIDQLTDYYTRNKVQPYGPYPASAEGGRRMDDAYARLGDLLNVTADEVLVGPSTSQNTYVLAHAFRPGWSAGDEIVVTDQDHEANSGAWRRLAATGIVVREWCVDPESGMLDPADLADLLTDRTRLVAFPHCSNIVRVINPVATICRMAANAGAVTVADGGSAAPHGLPDVDALGADIYLFSAYKTYGPHQGVMVVRSRIADTLANQSHWFNEGNVRARLVPAGPDHAQVAALNGLVDYMELLHERHFDDEVEAAERGRRVHDLLRAQETATVAPLLGYLRDRPDVRIMGPADGPDRVPTVAIVPRRPAPAVAEDLVGHRVMAGAGDFYAVRLVEAMGQPADPGVLRMSFVHYTSPAEVAQLIDALDVCL